MYIREGKTEIIGFRVTRNAKETIKKICLERGYKNISECLRDIVKKELGLKNLN